MKIKLACPSAWLERDDVPDGDVGAVVEVDDAVGDLLIREGKAQVDTSHLTAANVDHVAALAGVDVAGANTVAEKKAAIKAAQKED